MRVLTLLLFLLLPEPGASAGGAGGGGLKLTVTVSGVASGKGSVDGALYKSRDGFPTKVEKALAKTSVPAAMPSATLVFEGLEPGEYAVAVYHDENGNGKLDSNFIGIPKEPVAVSNDAKGRMGPPKYEDARFRLEGSKTITVKLAR